MLFSHSGAKNKNFDIMTNTTGFAFQMTRLQNVHGRTNRSRPIQMKWETIIAKFLLQIFLLIKRIII